MFGMAIQSQRPADRLAQEAELLAQVARIARLTAPQFTSSCRSERICRTARLNCSVACRVRSLIVPR